MTSRRAFIFAGACVAAAAAGYQLKPRRHVSLLGQGKLVDLVPTRFGDWEGRSVSNLVEAATEGSLVSKLYGQTLERVYRNLENGAEVMVLMAHGDTQSNALQLHRPEVCYPAFGFSITSDHPDRLALGAQAALPIRQLVADAGDRRENIVYWTRFGEFFPQSENEQRVYRVRMAMKGIVADGLLARFSVLDPDPQSSFTLMKSFVPAMLAATKGLGRVALVGNDLARRMTSAGL